jgi:hypothetical protein
MHHATGDVTQWMATFADRGSFGEVLEVHETARITGATGVVTGMESHPLLPVVVTVSPDGDRVELAVWQVQPPQGQGMQRTGVLRRLASTMHSCGDNCAVVLAWVPLAAHSIVVVATHRGLHVYRTDPAATLLRLEADSIVALGNPRSCAVHRGTGDGSSAFVVTVLGEDGGLSLWELGVAAEGGVHLAAVSVGAIVGGAAQPTTFVHAFETVGDHLSALGLCADAQAHTVVYLGVVTNTGSVGILRCRMAAPADDSGLACEPVLLLESPPNTVPDGEIEVIACSVQGHIAMALKTTAANGGTPRFDVSLWRWRLTNHGPTMEAVVFSGPTSTCDLVWGLSQNQKETL